MAPIAEVAKYKLQDVPEFAALRLPPNNATAESQVASAAAMAAAANAHLQTFIDSGLPPTFLDDIHAAATAVSSSLVDRDTHQGNRSGATLALGSLEKQARALLRMLNALIVAHVRTDPELKGAWMVAKSVRQKPGPAVGKPRGRRQAGDGTNAGDNADDGANHHAVLSSAGFRAGFSAGFSPGGGVMNTSNERPKSASTKVEAGLWPSQPTSQQ